MPHQRSSCSRLFKRHQKLRLPSKRPHSVVLKAGHTMSLGTGIFLASLIIGVIYLYVMTREKWRWGTWLKRITIPQSFLSHSVPVLFWSQPTVTTVRQFKLRAQLVVIRMIVVMVIRLSHVPQRHFSLVITYR